MSDRKFQDTMISARNYKKLVDFYKAFLGMEALQESEAFTVLKDGETGQRLCITNGQSVAQPSPGIPVTNLDAALQDIEALGGKVIKRWKAPQMKGANCEDPEGHELLIWEGNY